MNGVEPIRPEPVPLQDARVELCPMRINDAAELAAAAGDGELWSLWYTSVPAPGEAVAYVEAALAGQAAGVMLPWVVRLRDEGRIVGTTRYHDIVAEAGRVEIGYTWYAASVQRTDVNTRCKRLLLAHAFEQLGCVVVGLRTDSHNLISQRAISALGARLDGVIRRNRCRRDGSVGDTWMYSITREEWPAVRYLLDRRLARHGSSAAG